MQKLYFFIIFGLLATNPIFSQREIKLIFLDSITNTPINSVKVTDKTADKIYYSGFDGSVNFFSENQIILIKCEHSAYNSKAIKLKKQVYGEFAIYL